MNKILLQRTIFALFMSLALSFLMSGWVTFINLGLQAGFLQEWGNAFLLAWPAAAAIAFLLGPTIQRFSQFCVNKITAF